MSTAQASVGVIVVAAGSGTRLGYGLPKAQVPLAGEPILAHALRGVLAAGVRSTDLRGRARREIRCCGSSVPASPRSIRRS